MKVISHPTSRELRLLVQCLELYYRQAQSQKDIAKTLGVSAATVSRLLKRAFDEGYVRVEGTAPGKLRWRLGGGKQRADGTPRPVRIYNGNYRILNSFWT